MKKVIALVMCVAMLACIAVTASAATSATFTFSTVENAKVGDVVSVDMSIAEAKTMIGAIGFKFSYDDTYLKFVESPTTYNYFSTGVGAGGATAAGNEETMEVQMATADGFKAPGTVITLCFEVIEAIPDGEIAEVSAEIILAPTAAEGTVEYDAKVVAGGVKGPKAVTPPPSSTPSKDVTPPVVPSKPEDPKDNPKTGDVSGVAVAAGLCAVMAAAFVITKKVND